MSYLIYFPGATGVNDRHFVEAGLGDLLGHGNCPPRQFGEVLQNGPDGGRGLVAGFANGHMPRLGVFADLQQWTPAKPCPQSAAAAGQTRFDAGRFWLGRDRGVTVAPETIERDLLQSSEAVTLEDGQLWKMPIARRLPKQCQIDAETGEDFVDVADEHREYWRLSQEFYRLSIEYCGSAPGDEPREVELSISDARRLVMHGLQINYLVNRDVLDWLGLARHEERLFYAAGAVIRAGRDSRRHARHRKKKRPTPRYLTALAWSRGLLPDYAPSMFDFHFLPEF